MQWMLGRFVAAMLAVVLSACVSQQSTNPYNTDSALTNQARAHTELGAAYLQESKFEIALEEFNIALRNDPDYALAYNGLGLVYGTLGENAKADAAFQKALQLKPNSSESHNNYGNFLCKTNRYDESINHFLSAVKNPLYETPHLAYANAGICSIRKKDYINAERYLTAALQLQPLLHPAAYHLANLQFNRGDIKAAKATLQNTLIAAPSAEVLWLGIKIERVLGDKDNEASYAIQLRKQYPNSAETQLLLNSQH
ncbi:type IV pilus biogenesis/stability protein PilW [Methylophilaceae bacterium 11]|uniref:type IV pilus biogenesis/stability protein PilW n=1 Tax=Methylotenera sp. N17 TaxID=1502761 RepID=UPI00044B16EE|nr:type IV pilus biogenesis/stability protein PilW [Methylotenera sp. N17]EUJ10162.1 type IV pilus biogenesis/stability protein PilW [Methylophilaceae bacterium 11]